MDESEYKHNTYWLWNIPLIFQWFQILVSHIYFKKHVAGKFHVFEGKKPLFAELKKFP